MAEAEFIGDRKAAKRNGISERSLRSYRQRLESDESLAAIYAAKLAQLDQDWSQEAVRFLRRAIARMDELLDKAETIEDLLRIAEAAKIVGELQVVREALDEQPVRPGPREASPPTAGGAAGSNGHAGYLQ